MSSTTTKIAQSEWERHKDTIIELYGKKRLKDVREEMQSQYGFNASSWQYEMQLKRWGIRKNATRDEWRQYFATKDTEPLSTLSYAPGKTELSLIARKSHASKKRASRWVSETLATPNAPQDSGPMHPGHEARHDAMSILDGPVALQANVQLDIQDSIPNTAEVFHAHESPPVHTEPSSSNVFAGEDLPGKIPQTLSASPYEFAQSMDWSFTSFPDLSSSEALELQSLVFGSNTADWAELSLLDLPARNNLSFFFILEDATLRKELPFSNFEHILQTNGFILGKAARGPVDNESASKIVGAILLSKHSSIGRRATTNPQHFLRQLSSLFPVESSALITDSQAFETRFSRVLLFSMLNGFAGLNDIPMENIFRFLKGFLVNKLLLDILERCPRHVSRTLTDNIFRAAIEATDSKIVNLLLARELVDVDDTVCIHRGVYYTPIERAASLGSLKLIRTLVEAGADVNKFHADVETKKSKMDSALVLLMQKIDVASEWGRYAIQPELVDSFNMLVAAGARVHPGLMGFIGRRRTTDLARLLSQHIPPEGHREFFQIGKSRGPSYCAFVQMAGSCDDRGAAQWFREMFRLCSQLCCNECLVDFGDLLRHAAIEAAKTGKIELLQLLIEKANIDPRLPRLFTAAVRSQSNALIDFVLGHGPDLDPPAIDFGDAVEELDTTPIAEAVRYGNEDLIQKLEAGGCLDHLAEGERFEALVRATVDAGNTAYMKKLLARAVTSKQAYRGEDVVLALAMIGGHREMAQMLLDAGATTSTHTRIDEYNPPLLEALSNQDAQMLRTVIASGAPKPYHDEVEVAVAIAQADCSMIAAFVDEYPGIHLSGEKIQSLFKRCIETDTTDFFKELLHTLEPTDTLLVECLKTAVEFGHVDLVGYLLDMGANPLNTRVLQTAITDRPDMLRLLFQKERRRLTMPTCIGANILKSVMGVSPGDSAALDELLRTKAINFTRLETMKRFGHPDEEYALTPLGLAIQGSREHPETSLDAMWKFLQAGADPNGIAKDNGRLAEGSPLMTALMVAVGTGREDAVEMLLSHGADVNARPLLRTTRTALQHAAEIGNADMVSLLLRHGTDANGTPPSHGGATALQFAAISGNCNMAAEILDYGAQLDGLPSRIDGRWPLEGAAEAGRLDMIRFLWGLNVRAVAAGTFPGGFSERQCLRAMNFARLNGHRGCGDLISELSGISVDRLETDEYGAPWIA
ncbi:hypothetical protein diail_1229, partial [Diaporthe ilicicola]